MVSLGSLSISQIMAKAFTLLKRQKEFARYFISGCTATVMNLTAVWVSRQFTSYEVAVFIGALAGTITSYLLAKLFVFKADKKRFDHSEIIRFLSVHAVVTFQIWLVSVSLDRWLLPIYWSGDFREALASFIGVGSVVFTGFILHRKLTFRQP